MMSEEAHINSTSLRLLVESSIVPSVVLNAIGHCGERRTNHRTEARRRALYLTRSTSGDDNWINQHMLCDRQQDSRAYRSPCKQHVAEGRAQRMLSAERIGLMRRERQRTA
jgi:hypothetical protein